MTGDRGAVTARAFAGRSEQGGSDNKDWSARQTTRVRTGSAPECRAADGRSVCGIFPGKPIPRRWPMRSRSHGSRAARVLALAGRHAVVLGLAAGALAPSADAATSVTVYSRDLG